MGFTLIEMLVVIAIISILIGIGVNTFTIAQKKARDVRRKADLRTIKTAFFMYYQDKNGYCIGSWSDVAPYLPAGMLSSGGGGPLDPLGNDYIFHCLGGPINSPASVYDVGTTLENTGDPAISSSSCPQSGVTTYTMGTSNYCINQD